MKTNTLDKYERERRWVKGVFWITLLSHGYIYYLLPYLGYNFCDWSTSNKWWCNFSLYQNSYFFSCYIVLFIPIFFINSKNFKSWVKIPIIFSILGAIDIFLRKDSSQLDFFMIGPGPTIIYIYIIGFVWSLVIAFRNRKWFIYASNSSVKTVAPDPINDGPTYIEDPKIINIRPTPTPNATGTIIKVIKIKR